MCEGVGSVVKPQKHLEHNFRRGQFKFEETIHTYISGVLLTVSFDNLGNAIHKLYRLPLGRDTPLRDL